jgi:hypothetical protein
MLAEHVVSVCNQIRTKNRTFAPRDGLDLRTDGLGKFFSDVG